MRTLKEISAMNPSSYKVNDFELRRGNVLAWNDRIEIIVDGKSKWTVRNWAYKYGLCEGAQPTRIQRIRKTTK